MPRWLAIAAALTAACGDGADANRDASVADARLRDAAVVDADLRALPDLVVDRDRLLADLVIETQTFAPDACELDPDEACVGGPGERTLLRFSVETPNLGNADLFLGEPDAGGGFSYSACHDHHHFEGYADYRLFDGDGIEVGTGHKQAFCLLDRFRYVDDPDVASSARYYCQYQGLQRGWSDVYDSDLPCQFIDITGVPPGTYTLRIELNPAGDLPELSRANNRAEIPIQIGAAALAGPHEPCPTLSDHAAATPNRECGWSETPTSFSCNPGQLYRLGCAACAQLGSCTGNPMVRVCDGVDPSCSHPTSLASSDGSCSACPFVGDLACPPSGSIEVYTASASPGAAYTCQLALEPRTD